MMTHSQRSKLFRTRASAAAGLVAVALGFGAQAATADSADTATGSPDAARIARHPGIGEPLTVLPILNNRVEGAATAHRITYTSTALNGSRTIVSGLLYTPKVAPPANGWPVIAWAHGTTGVADVCAPSWTNDAFGYGKYLSAWLAQGYAVAATDYEGLGTPRKHPYIIGDSEGRSIIDMVRAARKVNARISDRYVTVGYSQGGQAALFAGKLDASYGAGLESRGTVAIAPGTQWKMLMAHWQAFVPKAQANPLVLLVLSGLNTARPASFPYAELLTPRGRVFMGLAETVACANSTDLMKGQTNEMVFAVNTAEATRIQKALAELAEPPVTGYRDPILLVQGRADELVPAAATQATAEQMRKAGTAYELKLYDGITHMNVLEASLPDVSAWVKQRLQ